MSMLPPCQITDLLTLLEFVPESVDAVRVILLLLVMSLHEGIVFLLRVRAIVSGSWCTFMLNQCIHVHVESMHARSC